MIQKPNDINRFPIIFITMKFIMLFTLEKITYQSFMDV